MAPDSPFQLRVILPGVGVLSAVAFWVLFEVLPDHIAEGRWLLLLAAFTGSFSSFLLVSIGPLSERRAAYHALWFGAITALLLFWSTWRFTELKDAVDAVHLILAYCLLTSLSVPFIQAYETASEGWRDYEALFDNAWSIFVRSLTAWAFTGLFWLVLFLCDALLSLVGFTLIGEVIEYSFVWMVLTGVVLGLALSVLDEMTGVVSTMRGLALKLLRLLLPLVAAVIALFICLVPFRGLELVFGSFSAATTMLAMVAGGTALITSAVEARDSDAATSKIMILAARGLSLLLPVIAGIAVYAIWIRVAQYGWTPSRLAGTLSALAMMGYALSYGVSVALGAGWQARIRRSNVYMALLIIALAGLWLSPVLNAEKISANGHVKRFLSGQIAVKDLEIFKLGEDWGKPGLAALEALRKAENPPEAEALAERLTAFDSRKSTHEARMTTRALARAENLETLKTKLPLRPSGAIWADAAFQDLSIRRLSSILEGCVIEIDPDRPGCVAIAWRSEVTDSADTIGVFYLISETGPLRFVAMMPPEKGNRYFETTSTLTIGDHLLRGDALATLRALQDGKFIIAPAKLNAIELNGMQLLPRR